MYSSQNRNNIIEEIKNLKSNSGLVSILLKDITSITDEQSIESHKAELSKLKEDPNNKNLIESINERIAACDTQLEKLKPKTLSDLIGMSETLANVIEFYEDNRKPGKILSVQGLFD